MGGRREFDSCSAASSSLLPSTGTMAEGSCALSAWWPAVAESERVPAGRHSPLHEADFSLQFRLAMAGSEFISVRFSRTLHCLNIPRCSSFLFHIPLEVERWPCSHHAGWEVPLFYSQIVYLPS